MLGRVSDLALAVGLVVGHELPFERVGLDGPLLLLRFLFLLALLRRWMFVFMVVLTLTLVCIMTLTVPSRFGCVRLAVLE